jgi:hypothetical protein
MGNQPQGNQGQSQGQSGQGQSQGQGGQDAMGRKPSDPGYDATSDPTSPQYDPSKAGQDPSKSR